MTTSRRPARINPDTLPVVLVTITLTAGLAAASFALTFAALRDVAAWANVAPDLAWAVPVMLDAAIIVYTLAVLVHRARHESAWTAWLPLAGFTAVSVVANAAHAGTIPAAWQSIIGTIVAGLAPVAVLMATHTLARLLVAPAADTIQESRIADTVQTETDTDSERRPDVEAVRVVADVSASAAEPDTAADVVPEADAVEPDSEPDEPDEVPAQGVRLVSASKGVRRHTGTGGRRRAADFREDIVRLKGEGLSVRDIAEQVGVGKTAVATLLQAEAA